MFEWTRIDSQLPSEDGEYLVCDEEDGFIDIAEFSIELGYFIDEFGFPISQMMHTFTHWLPLPERPKKTEDRIPMLIGVCKIPQ